VTYPPQYQPAPPPANDRVTLYGVLGIVGMFCCWPVGLVFAILGLQEAKKVGKSPTLAYVAFGLLALAVIGNIIWFAAGGLNMFNR
jgi:hypothetical protein